jgi:phosphomannomutase
VFFAFDVDGTLTPSRQRIDPDFEQWFIKWISMVQEKGHSVLLVTGSDYDKTVEQLGAAITESVDYCCNCLGNAVLQKNKLIHSYEFSPSDELLKFLQDELANSAYTERYGNHIENRSSMINFSVVGRNAVGEQRSRYYEWDKHSCERLSIAERINNAFPSVSAQAGGETGIDIIPKGKDKRQVIEYMQGEKVLFFGDRLDDGGNDKPLADALLLSDTSSESLHVKSWNETWEMLKDISINTLHLTVHP